MLDLHRALVASQHSLVQAAAEERDAAISEPRLHFLITDPADGDDFARLAIPLSARFGARHDAARPVYGRIEAVGRFGALDPGQDHGIIPHRAAHEPALAREGRGRALADDPQLAVAMRFAPGVVVVIVDAVGHRSSD